MSRLSRTSVSILIMISLVLSMTGCFNKPYKDVYGATEEILPVLVKFDHIGVKDLSLSSYEYDEATIRVFDYPMYTPNENFHPIGKIIGSITYEIDSDTLEANSKEGSVNVIFTMLDYSKLRTDINSKDTTNLTINFKFANEDGKWLLSNTSEVVQSLYYFIDELNRLYDASL